MTVRGLGVFGPNGANSETKILMNPRSAQIEPTVPIANCPCTPTVSNLGNAPVDKSVRKLTKILNSFLWFVESKI